MRIRAILNELSLLLIPAGVVTLFCQVLGIDSRATGVYSIATILLVGCCLHRSWINHRVPAALVLAITIGLGGIFYFNYQYILMKDTGLIRRFQVSSDLQAELGTQMSRTEQEMWLFGTNFHISTTDRRQVLIDRLKAGVRVRYLILDPFLPTLDQVARDFDQPAADLEAECLSGLRSLLELKRQWQEIARGISRPGDLEIRIYNSTPRARLYVFDPDRPAGRTVFIPYINKMNSPDLPAYLLTNTRGGVFGTYFNGLQRVWQQAEPLDSILSRHPEFKQPLVATGPPAFTAAARP